MFLGSPYVPHYTGSGFGGLGFRVQGRRKSETTPTTLADREPLTYKLGMSESEHQTTPQTLNPKQTDLPHEGLI